MAMKMEAAQGLRLDTLPTELLWRIACELPPEVCLTLTAVSRSLRNALLDKFVFKDIIKRLRLDARACCRRSPKLLPYLHRKDEELTSLHVAKDLRAIPPTSTLNQLDPLLGDDLQAWIRVAVAESKIYQAHEQLVGVLRSRRTVLDPHRTRYLDKEALILHIIHKYGTALTVLNRE